MTRKLPLYFDYAATTPVDSRVAEKMMGCLTAEGVFGNPASRSHIYGWEAEELVEAARQQVADLIGADSREIIWTSGATESNNLAIKGLARALRDKGRHLICARTEHHAVLDCFQQLVREGFDVSFLQPDEYGLVSADALAEALRPDTLLVSLMHVNNELGSANDIAALAELCQDRGVFLHTDAAQSTGKLPIDLAAVPVDLLSISAHKIYGPKGVGALFVRRRPNLKLEPMIHGGGHQRGLRSGTLATHQIVGLGEALHIAGQQMEADLQRISQLAARLQAGLLAIPATRLNGHPTQNYPGILNISFGYVDGEALLVGLKDFALSSGSACTSASQEASHVLRAIGLDEQAAQSSIRFSLGRTTSEADVDELVAQTTRVVGRLRQLSPEWSAAH